MLRYICLIGLMLTLAACGRVSEPIPPVGTIYPGDYVVRGE